MGNIPILVISCDNYRDLWRPFFTIFWQRWPDCPYPVHLGANHESFQDPRVKTVAIGDDVCWATGARRMLVELGAEYVIIFLEDFLLQNQVVTPLVEELVGIAMKQQLGCLRLIPNPPPSRALAEFPGLGIIAPGDDYRVSTQVAVWRAETMHRLLWPGFSAWDFELIGSALSDYLPDPFWGVCEPAIVYRHGVERGKWLPQGLAICREAGATVDLASRPALTNQELMALRKRGLKSRIAMWVPRWIRRRRCLGARVDHLLKELRSDAVKVKRD